MDKFIKGADLSTLQEVISCGGRFFDKGIEGDAIEILKSYGFNAVRLRLWLDPKDEEGNPYGAGNCDYDTMLPLAKKVTAEGLDFLLDLHYSDFWTDPGKQLKPKAWRDLSPEQTEEKIYEYTFKTVSDLMAAGAAPTMIQVGNELSNGMLWPDARIWPDGTHREYRQLARYISCGIRACRAVNENIPIMIHLDNGGNNELYRRWFDSYFDNGGEEFDIIGLSYYPFWHGTLDMLSANMADISARYDKPLIVAEVSMGFTMEDYRSREGEDATRFIGMATRPEVAAKAGYPMTPQGQCAFLQDFMEAVKAVPKSKGLGFYYWEPCWLPLKGSGWATPASLKYMDSPGPCGNEWANQALFDYDGNALPALAVIRDFS